MDGPAEQQKHLGAEHTYDCIIQTSQEPQTANSNLQNPRGLGFSQNKKRNLMLSGKHSRGYTSQGGTEYPTFVKIYYFSSTQH